MHTAQRLLRYCRVQIMHGLFCRVNNKGDGQVPPSHKSEMQTYFRSSVTVGDDMGPRPSEGSRQSAVSSVLLGRSKKVGTMPGKTMKEHHQNTEAFNIFSSTLPKQLYVLVQHQQTNLIRRSRTKIQRGTQHPENQRRMTYTQS